MSALAQCDAFAFIYDQAGDPAPDVLVVLKRVLDASGNPILLSPKTTVTDSAGSFHFTLPEFATAFISARASALWNCPDGLPFTVPSGPSGELIAGFSLTPSATVMPPLVYVGDVLSIPKASETQDGYLSAADYVRFEAGGAEVGVTQIDTGTGLTGGPITDTGTIGLATISGVAGTWSNPSSITVNAQGQIIAITAGAPDTIAPVITLVASGSITATSVVITWHTNEPADSQVEYGSTTSYGTSTTLDTASVLDHSVTITGLTGSTLYHYRVKSKDTAGNPSTSGDNTFTTTAVVDTTAPIITAITATAITDTGATITWTTNEASDSQVEYGLTTSYGSSTTLDATMVTSHSVPITGTTASTLYHYRVKSRDAASNLQTSGDNTFTTAAAAPHLLSGLTSMWKLDETGTANRIDSHGTNHLFSASITAVAGKIGQAAHFLADGNAMGIASNSTLLTGDIDYTFAFWVNLDNLTPPTGSGKVIAKASGVAGEHEYSLDYSVADAKFRYTVAGGTPTLTYTSVLASVPSPPVVGTWYLVIFWHQISDGKVYIQVNNGTPEALVRVEPMFASNASPLTLASYGASPQTPSDFVACLVDEAAFWKGRVLSASERAALYAGGAGLPFSSWT